MGSLTNKNKSARANSSRHYSLYKQRSWHHRKAEDAGRCHTASGSGEQVRPGTYAHIQIATLRIPWRVVADFRFVQTEPGKGKTYSTCYVYAFFVTFEDLRNGKPCRLKYIVRAEVYDDVFAIKFYASRDRKNPENKYSIGHSQISVKGVYEILNTTLDIMVNLLKQFPTYSFIIKGAEAYDPATKKEEDEFENQRFRIYRSFLAKRIGTKTFTHFQFPAISVYLLVNNNGTENPTKKKDEIIAHFKDIYNLDWRRTAHSILQGPT